MEDARNSTCKDAVALKQIIIDFMERIKTFEGKCCFNKTGLFQEGLLINANHDAQGISDSHLPIKKRKSVGQLVIRQQRKRSRKYNHSCNYPGCSRTFDGPKPLAEHYNAAHSNENLLFCHYCDFSTRKWSSYFGHHLRHNNRHTLPAKKPTDLTPYMKKLTVLT